MLYKVVSITLLLIFNATMNARQAQDDAFPLATTPYSKESALFDLRQAGYQIEETALVFKGNPDTGANFVDAIISQIDSITGETIEIRVVCYGPGRHVGDHTHDEAELFHVTRGRCKVFILQEKNNPMKENQDLPDDQKNMLELSSHHTRQLWNTVNKKPGDDIIIPAHTRHALIAGKKGLCMHVARNDNTRSVSFTKTAKQPWEQD